MRPTLEPAGLHIGGNVAENLRRALPEERLHGAPRHRTHARAPDGEVAELGGSTDPDGPDLLGSSSAWRGNARNRHQNRRFGSSALRGRSDAARRIRDDGRSGSGGVRDRRCGNPTLGARDDGPAHDRSGRARRHGAARPGPEPCCWSSSTECPPRWRRTLPRSSGSAPSTAPESGAATNDVARALLWKGRKVGVRGDGPGRNGLRAGRAARNAPPGRPTPDRVVSGSTGFGSATCSTRVTATSIRLFRPTLPKARRNAAILAEVTPTPRLDAGGSLTGEHGVGMDKACSMPRILRARPRRSRGCVARSTRTGSATRER